MIFTLLLSAFASFGTNEALVPLVINTWGFEKAAVTGEAGGGARCRWEWLTCSISPTLFQGEMLELRKSPGDVRDRFAYVLCRHDY